MLTNLLDLDNTLSVRDIPKEEKSSKRSTGVLNIIMSFNIVSQVLYLFCLVNYQRIFGSSGRISGVIL